MSRLTPQISAFNYATGRSFVDALKIAANVEKDAQLSDVYGIPRNTISTWVTRDICNHEMLVRAVLAFDLDLKAFALAGEVKRKSEQSNNSMKTFKMHKIKNGTLEDVKTISFDTSLFDFNVESCEMFQTEMGKYFVDIEKNEIDAGEYFVDLDGRIQAIKLQRLPASQVQMNFGETSVVVNAESLNVIGRIMMKMETA